MLNLSAATTPSTNMARADERVVAFYNQRGTAEQHIKEGKNAVRVDAAQRRTGTVGCIITMGGVCLDARRNGHMAGSDLVWDGRNAK